MEKAHGKLFPQVRGVGVMVGGLEVYKVSFPRIINLVEYLVEGCLAMKKTPGRLMEHFMFRHCKSKVAILQEGPEPLPLCNKCGMHIQATRHFNYQHSDKCHKLTERRL